MTKLTDGELSDVHAELLEYMFKAMDKLRERDAVYRGLWIDGGAESNLFHSKQKAVRLWRNYIEHGGEMSEDFMDDAVDMMNYLAFAMYCYDHGLLKGTEDDAST